MEKNELLCFGKQYVLFELPSNSRPAMIEEIVFKMNLNGYQPVLAHPERYPYFHDKKMYEYQKLKDHGVLFQLNLMSLTGYYNPGIRAVARDLIRHEMVDFAGTDIHKENICLYCTQYSRTITICSCFHQGSCSITLYSLSWIFQFDLLMIVFPISINFCSVERGT